MILFETNLELGRTMLIVFLAIPALQRNQRNNARNSEASRIQALVTECLANRNGQRDSCDSVSATEVNFIAADFGHLTTLNITTNATTEPVSGTAAAGVWFGRTCAPDGASATDDGATARSFAVLYTLEPDITRCVTG